MNPLPPLLFAAALVGAVSLLWLGMEFWAERERRAAQRWAHERDRTLRTPRVTR